MESFFRYISYIDLYENNNKIKNTGFLRWKYQNQTHNIELHIKDANNLYGNFKIEEKKTGSIFGIIKLDQGIGSYNKIFSSVSDSDAIYVNTENSQIRMNEIQGFYIWLDAIHYLFVPINLPIEKLKTSSTYSELPIHSETETASKNNLNETNILESNEDSFKNTFSDLPLVTKKTDNNFIEDIKILEPLHEDKWQQLNKKYPKVHPFSNNSCFLSIKPDDFIILQKAYQKLVQNSFLLHGYYNYGHLILGKLTEEENAPFYIGVPGVYYDREKQAAQMFGFIGFESTEQPVQAGSYGYYMIEVMI